MISSDDTNNMIDKMIVSHQTLTSLTHHLPESQFMRVHKSFLISIDKIELIEGNRIHIQNHKITYQKKYILMTYTNLVFYHLQGGCLKNAR